MICFLGEGGGGGGKWKNDFCVNFFLGLSSAETFFSPFYIHSFYNYKSKTSILLSLLLLLLLLLLTFQRGYFFKHGSAIVQIPLPPQNNSFHPPPLQYQIVCPLSNILTYQKDILLITLSKVPCTLYQRITLCSIPEHSDSP